MPLSYKRRTFGYYGRKDGYIGRKQIDKIGGQSEACRQIKPPDLNEVRGRFKLWFAFCLIGNGLMR